MWKRRHFIRRHGSAGHGGRGHNRGTCCDGRTSGDRGCRHHGSGQGSSGILASVCPATVVIQTDWNPEAEHGFLYNLLGTDYTVDKAKVSVTGTLTASGGVDTGVKLEVRSGGPAIGFGTVTAQMYTDPDILLAYVYTDEAIQNSAQFPTVAIESGFEKNPQMIMWTRPCTPT
jgi:hypothetical protein